MFHRLISRGTPQGHMSFATDRMRFIGRGRSVADPQALDEQGALSDSEGAMLDPVAAIRCEVVLTPGETGIVDLLTGVGDSRDACIALLRTISGSAGSSIGYWPAASARVHALLTTLQCTEAEAQLYAGAGSFRHLRQCVAARRRKRSSRKMRRVSRDFGATGSRGMFPVVLLQTSDAARHYARTPNGSRLTSYWRLQGVTADLVILCNDDKGRRP